ncbi:MAG: tRNA (adenosine(37)-N6)-dimethylallyltransferase MiaA [Flavobacteriales bacterium]|nr:tRNA (adenosine(37)-N6)-dimethylallyltransferase MiaA [Flavobacteriales bacterium]
MRNLKPETPNPKLETRNPKLSKTLIVVCGPTAVGKTKLAIELALHLNTEIISADSRQLYHEIPIGTAQPTKEQLGTVKHHFISERSIAESYNAGMFERDALERLDEIFKTHQQAVVCGGTGLYIKALCEGLDDLPKADEIIREKLMQQLEKDGLESLQKQLKKLDPVHYSKMDVQNPQRVIRALEVCLSTGKPFSSFHLDKKKNRPFKIVKIGLQLPKEELNIRIDKRVDAMLANGWLQEVKNVFDQRHHNALNTVGYKELFAHLAGEMTLSEATEKIKTNTRRFAKRQMTWFRKDEEVKWLEKPTVDGLLRYLG